MFRRSFRRAPGDWDKLLATTGRRYPPVSSNRGWNINKRWGFHSQTKPPSMFDCHPGYIICSITSHYIPIVVGQIPMKYHIKWPHEISFDQWNGTYSPFPSHLPVLVVQPAISMAIFMAIPLYGLPLGIHIHMATAGAFEWPWNGMGTKPVMSSLWETPCVSCWNAFHLEIVKRPRNLQKNIMSYHVTMAFHPRAPTFNSCVSMPARCHLHSEFSQLWPKKFMANFWQLPHDAVLCYLVGEH